MPNLIYDFGGQTPARSSRAIAWSENSACGASPPMTNIRIDSWFGSPLVTFSKRRIIPGGNETDIERPKIDKFNVAVLIFPARAPSAGHGDEGFVGVVVVHLRPVAGLGLAVAEVEALAKS